MRKYTPVAEAAAEKKIYFWFEILFLKFVMEKANLPNDENNQ